MRFMRALGPGSVSSILKAILDVVFVALWIALGVIGLITLAAIFLGFNPDLISDVVLSKPGGALLTSFPAIVIGLLGAGLYSGGILIIVSRLRKIFATLMAGDPFHPDNVARLRVIGAALGGLELVKYAIWASGTWLIKGHNRVEPNLSLTAWFSVLVVFVLAEVFREGARLRREAELTI